MPSRVSLVVTILWIGCSLAAAEETSATASGADEQPLVAFFETRIRPALIEHCLDCHSEQSEASGGLVLDTRAGWETGGDLGPAIVPGNPDESLLIRAIEYGDPDLQMPPEGKLDEGTLAAFRRWIRQGAVDPRQVSPNPKADRHPAGLPVAKAQDHWAYRPLDRNETAFASGIKEASGPKDADSPPRPASVIDQLIESRLQAERLNAAPPADRRALIRRLTFDLHGLPPTPQQVESFLQDQSPDAYERLVDRLLASPSFGEHFARHWMDVVRYAESITLRGFVLPQAWRYRDYLVQAFASDRPFDQMIRDQIAGDLMPVDDLHERQQRAIATGFWAFGNSNLEDQDKTNLDFDHVDEQLETLGRAFLAQTIGCARCHDHKFDPIPTKDYYALAGILRSTTAMTHANVSKWIERPVPLNAEDERAYRELQSQFDRVQSELKAMEANPSGSGSKAKRIKVASLAGIVVDDDDARFVGDWKSSQSVSGYVGNGYHHDQQEGAGTKTATFEPDRIPTGRYRVRMAYTPNANRSSKVRVQVFSANESTTVVVNQRQRPSEDSVWVSLGVFPFEETGQAFVMVSNEDADGYVVVDAIQFLPVGEAFDPAEASPEGDQRAEKEPTAVADRREKLTRKLRQLRAQLDARPQYLTILESEPQREIAIRIRGNVHQSGERVPRGFLSAIAPAEHYAAKIDPHSSGRVAMANWIADPRNPLTARVYANRVWSWLMGDGIVTTENNFGTTGRPPSHPALLDWLSGELIRHDWSTKHLVKVIVTSRAYRRALTDDPDRMAVDPDNRLFASGPLKRLPAEAIRDAMLQISGELDRSFGGSMIQPGTKSDYGYRHSSRRRSLYAPVFRNSLPPLFRVFDFADASVSVGQRPRSTVAPQSLAMMNHPWVIARSRATAERLGRSSGTEDPTLLIRQLYQQCFARPPDDSELQLCLQFLRLDGPQGSIGDPAEISTDRWALLVQSLFASVDFRYLD
ncbi:DUF1553 domain-containing protein [Roseiconus nitratireducens]|uniref:DUF1553 domain-containing protein n=1 Tax=Roseiconus nitratireducens TaxID=2605748 RepID=UPI001375FD64|nr:DUF1553 domain-containing protein [Roseiconus nitratireducens]